VAALADAAQRRARSRQASHVALGRRRVQRIGGADHVVLELHEGRIVAPDFGLGAGLETGFRTAAARKVAELKCGAARKVAGQLVGRGYAIVATDNDPLSGVRPVEGAAEVRYGPAGARAAALVRRQVPGATLYKDAREGPIVDLVLGDQFRRLSTPAELARRRQGPLPSEAAPGAAPAGTPVVSAKKAVGGSTSTRTAAPSPSPSC